MGYGGMLTLEKLDANLVIRSPRDPAVLKPVVGADEDKPVGAKAGVLEPDPRATARPINHEAVHQQVWTDEIDLGRTQYPRTGMLPTVVNRQTAFVHGHHRSAGLVRFTMLEAESRDGENPEDHKGVFDKKTRHDVNSACGLANAAGMGLASHEIGHLLIKCS